jgi:predicted AlkP superfamily pyrophosphatase or phosphodiesterase
MMLPAVPKSLGRLSDVFISALGSITGNENRLGLPKAKSACVILVDGLGAANIRYRAGHANFLANQLANDGTIMAGFPSTTVTSLVSFSTGLKAGEHAMVGYQIHDRKHGSNVNLLTGIGSATEALVWQSRKTVAEVAAEVSIDCYFIGPAEYENSGFTNATMRGAKYVAAKTLDDRVTAAKKILNSKESSLVYLYVPELDQRAHAYGSKSAQWVEKLEDLDLAVRQLTSNLPANVGILLTADHGIVDVAHERQIYLDEMIISGLVSVGGDPRVLFLYLDSQHIDEAELETCIHSIQQFVGKRAYVVARDDLITQGWYGQVSDEARDRMPDVFVIAHGETALYHREFSKPKSLQMIGQHGAISDDELFVPLLRFGAFKKR